MIELVFVLVGTVLTGLLYWLLSPVPIPAEHRVGKAYYEHGSRRFLLTGSASGLSKHVANELLRRGHRVVATDKNFKLLERVYKEELGWEEKYQDRCKIFALDVRDRKQWASVIAEAKDWLGALDVVMNIAGYLRPTCIQDASEADIDLHLDVNLKGVVNGTWAACRHMIECMENGELKQGAHIINIASLGAIAPVDGVTLYVGSKYGVRGFSLCAAKDLAPKGVYVTVVCPDAIQTPMVDLQLHYKESSMAYSGKILTLEQVSDTIFNSVLPNRPREVFIASEFIRGKMARVADVFHSSRLVYYSALQMKKAGETKQKEILNAKLKSQ